MKSLSVSSVRMSSQRSVQSSPQSRCFLVPSHPLAQAARRRELETLAQHRLKQAKEREELQKREVEERLAEERREIEHAERATKAFDAMMKRKEDVHRSVKKTTYIMAQLGQRKVYVSSSFIFLDLLSSPHLTM